MVSAVHRFLLFQTDFFAPFVVNQTDWSSESRRFFAFFESISVWAACLADRRWPASVWLVGRWPSIILRICEPIFLRPLNWFALQPFRRSHSIWRSLVRVHSVWLGSLCSICVFERSVVQFCLLCAIASSSIWQPVSVCVKQFRVCSTVGPVSSHLETGVGQLIRIRRYRLVTCKRQCSLALQLAL